MRFRIVVGILFAGFILSGMSTAQVLEQEIQTKERSTPQVIDFSRFFNQQQMTREEFETWKTQRELRLRERFTQMEALEGAVDPGTYIVGPGDLFSFNVWGTMEIQFPVAVSPEGKLLVPTVGEVEVDGKRLDEVQDIVISKAAPIYENSNVSLTLEALRIFRVQVIGEVQYPATYFALAVDRLSEMIKEAGGITDWAWMGGIEVRHTDGTVERFDLDAFEQDGDLQETPFINGGDVIYVPPIKITENLVHVKSDMESSGWYQISPNEKLLKFLQRIRVLNRNSDLTQIIVIRKEDPGREGAEKKQFLTLLQIDGSIDQDFILEHGDEILLPSQYVYVKGAVQKPGAYPFVLNLTAKDYAGMAGGDFQSGHIKKIKVYHVSTGKTEKGPDILVQAGDIVHLNTTWTQRLAPFLQIISVTASIVIAARAAGLFGQ